MRNKSGRYNKVFLFFFLIVMLASGVDLIQIIQNGYEPTSGKTISILGFELLQINLSSILLIITGSIGLLWLCSEKEGNIEEFGGKSVLLIIFLGCITSASLQLFDGEIFAIASDTIVILSGVAIIILLLQNRRHFHSDT